MKLMGLEIRNFQGIGELKLSPDGKNLDVFGDNGTRKTTIVSALSWLLTGKDALGRSDFAIKPLNQYGESILDGEVSVSGEFLLYDGAELCLGKTYKEKMVTSRNAGTASFAGHTTDYMVDGVPCQKKEYDEKVKAIADPEMFRALTDPFYFAEALHWTKRREWLLRVCGDVKFEDVIAAEAPELNDVPAIIGKHTVAEHRKVLASSGTEVAKELKEIPARIDEQKRNVRDDLPDLAIDLQHEKGLIAQIDSLQGDVARLAAGGQDSELRSQIREAEAELSKVRADARATANGKAEREYKKANEAYHALMNAASTAALDLKNLHRAAEAADSVVADIQARVPGLQASIDELTALYEEVAEGEYSGAEECPTCGQMIPDADRFNAIQEFNLQRSQRLERVVADGKAARKRLDACEKELEKAVGAASSAWNAFNTAAQTKPAPLSPAPKMPELPADFTTPEIGTAERKVAELKDRLKSLTVDTSEKDKTAAALTAAQDELETLQTHINATRAAEALSNQARTRIEELKKRRQAMKEQSDIIERHLHLLAQFERAQALLLSERVNPKFKLVSWKLFDEQVNGDYNPCCEATVGGVPFNSGLNNGARINAGLDIINTLSRHAGVSLPVCVDNAESVTRLFPLDAQILRFVVSEQDKTLRVEIAE